MLRPRRRSFLAAQLAVFMAFFVPGTSARAQPPPTQTFELSLRTGHSFPIGEATKGRDLAAYATGMVPIWLDLGYRISPNIFVGVHAQHGFIHRQLGCPREVTCLSYDLRFGAEVHLHLTPRRLFDTWLGFGAGYEMMGDKFVRGARYTVRSVKHGIELANVQFGFDYKAARTIGFGPFISASTGMFLTDTVSGTYGRSRNAMTARTMHGWLTIGIRGVFDVF